MSAAAPCIGLCGQMEAVDFFDQQCPGSAFDDDIITQADESAVFRMPAPSYDEYLFALLVTEARNKALQEQQRLAEEARRGPFRFTDLTAEMRNVIYLHVLANEVSESQDLRVFKIPSISLVSKQLYNESLYLFFATTSFYIDIFSNLRDRRTVRERLQRGYDRNSNVGRLCMNRSLNKYLKNQREHALIKDITIKVKATSPWHDAEHLLGGKDHRVSCHIRLRTRPCGLLHITVKPGHDHPLYSAESRAPHFTHELQDLEAAVDLAKSEAQRIATRESFKGFSHGDLLSLAKQLRYIPPEVASGQV